MTTYRLRVELEPQPEGGYTVTSPDLPELITEGNTVEEAFENVGDALKAVLEIYEDEGRTIPRELIDTPSSDRRIKTQLVLAL